METYFAIATQIHGKTIIFEQLYAKKEKAEDVAGDYLPAGRMVVVPIQLPWEPQNLIK